MRLFITKSLDVISQVAIVLFTLMGAISGGAAGGFWAAIVGLLGGLVFSIVFFGAFAAVLFFAPEMGGYFLEHANFEPANLKATPEHIAPVWYFTPFYAILRAVPSKLGGVVLMGGAIFVLFLLIVLF